MIKKILFLTVLFMYSASYVYASSYKELLFQVYTNNIDTEELINIKVLKNKFYLPLEDLLETFHFNVKYTYPFLIQGTYFNKFNIQGSTLTGIFQINNSEIKAAQDSFITLNNQLLIESTFLEKLFNITLNFKINDLELNINSIYKFPTEIQKIKLFNRNNYLNEKRNIKTDYTKYNLLSPWFSAPLIDLSLSYNKSNSPYYNNSSISSNLALGMVFAGLNTTLYSNNYLRGLGDKNSLYSNTRIKLYKHFLGNQEYLRYLEIGDVNSRSTPLINNSRYGRGIFITSDSYYNINYNNTTNISGYLKDGWDVELYYNNSLIAYQGTPNKNHFYEFKDVLVYKGANYFTLIFYGPFGEVIKEPKVINLANSPVRQNHFSYTVALLQYEKSLFNKDYQNYLLNDSNNLSSYLNLYYGILDNLSFNFNYTNINDKNSVNNFFTQGLIFSWQKLSLEAYISEKDGYRGAATSLNISSGFPTIGKFNLLYNNYNSIMSPLSKRYNLFYLKSSLEARYNNYIRLLGLNLPITVHYKNYNYLNIGSYVQNEEHLLAIETNKYLGYHTSLDLSFEYNKQGLFYNYNIHPVIISKINNLSFQGDYQFSIYPNLRNNYFLTRMSYNFRNSLSAFIGVNFFLNSNNNILSNTYSMGFAKNIQGGSLNINLSLRNKNNYNLNLYYNISLGYIPKFRKLITSNNLINNSALLANMVVEDGSGNIISNSVKGVKLVINSARFAEESDENGHLVIKSLRPYQPINVTLDLSSVDNIMLLPKVTNPEYHIILKPSTVNAITIPFIFTGHIEGEIKYKNKSKNTCRIFKVNLINNKKDFIKNTTVDNSGSFSFGNIPYGKYQVKYRCVNLNKIKEITDEINVNNDINYIQYNP